MKTLPIFILLLLSISASAKVPGYQGHRFILKTDLSSLIDRGGSASLEIAIARHMTIEPEYRFYNKTIKFPLSYEDGNQYSYTIEYLTEKAHIVEHAVFLNLKFFTSKSKTAPKGFYTFLKFGVGRASITSNGFVNESVEDPDFPGEFYYKDVLKSYKLKNVRTIHAAIGVGVNYIFAKRLLCDIAWGLQYSNMNAKQYKSYLDGYTNKFGPNVVSFIPSTTRKDESLRFAFGFMFKASIGVILF